MRSATPATRAFAFLLLLLALWPLSAAGQDRVGVTTAVNPSASSTPPGGVVRKIVVGQTVLYNEHIATGPTGQTEILFLDQSAFTVGPNADLVIDEFVYDPRTAQGKLAISVGHGVFRYVGGKLSKSPNAVTIRTPTATIGVRGGEILLNVNSAGKVDALLVYGKALTVTGKSGCTQELERVGYALTSSGPDGCPSAGHPVSVAAITGYLTQLDGLPGAHAGATTTPTDQTIAQSGVASTISGNFTGNVLALNQIRPPAPTVNPTTVEGSFQQNNVQGQTPIVTAPSGPTVSMKTTGGFASSIGPNSGAFYGTLNYPTTSFQGGAISVTVGDIVTANNIVLHNGQPLSSVPNLTAFLSGFSGGATLSPLTAGASNIPVTLSIAAAYNGPPLPTTPTPTTGFSLNLGVVATGTATVTPDGQLVVANLVLNGPGIAQFESLTGVSPTKVDNSGVPGSSLFLFNGVPTVPMPTAGIGTFNGTATGSVTNGSSQYAAAGTFSESYNFATRAGTLNIGNFDNATYTAPVTGSGNTYSGTLSALGRTGAVTGGFFGPVAGETGGTFTINGTSGPKYIAAGIFTGH